MNEPIRCLFNAADIVGESPIWSPEERCVYWVGVTRPAIRRLVLDTGEVVTMEMTCEVGAVALRARGGLVVATRKGFQFVDFHARTTSLITDPEPHLPGNSLNEGKCDRRGRFWAGSGWYGEGKPGEKPPAEPSAALYRLDSDLSCHRMAEGLRESNTIAWSPDDRVMYVGNSGSVGIIHAYDYDLDSGAITNRRVFANTKDGIAVHDGSAIDSEGYLWTTIWNLLIRDTPSEEVYVLNMFRMRGSRL